MTKDDPTTMRRDNGPFSTTALISYMLICQFTLCMMGVFWVIFMRVPVDPTMLTVMGAIVTAAVACTSVVGGFWLASSNSASANAAAMRQLAGAGPPPPADPSSSAPDKPA